MTLALHSYNCVLPLSQSCKPNVDVDIHIELCGEPLISSLLFRRGMHPRLSLYRNSMSTTHTSGDHLFPSVPIIIRTLILLTMAQGGTCYGDGSHIIYSVRHTRERPC